jgi:ABC-type Fe3+/spermidine/putrescine transport system ATPase subunit
VSRAASRPAALPFPRSREGSPGVFVSTAFVDLQNLTKSYNGVPALKGVSLQVNRNEFVSLLGHSGCGKTTTLRIILGFLECDSGSITIDGRDMTNVPPRHRGMGMVFQSYALWPHMTVFENVAFGLRVRKLSEAEIHTRVMAAIDRLQLTGLDQRTPRELSGGQQQRVALARALVIRPPLLLLDEPLSNLDRQLREDMRLELKHLQKSLAQTTIYVTHDQEEALSLSDRVVVMNAGLIEQVGTPHEVYYRPQSEFVARFIGKASFLPVQIEQLENDGRNALRLTSGQSLSVADLRQAKPFAAGTSAIMAVRPEEIVVAEGVATDTITAKISEYLFLGNVFRYQLVLPDGTDIFLDSRAALSAAADGTVNLRILGGCLVERAHA